MDKQLDTEVEEVEVEYTAPDGSKLPSVLYGGTCFVPMVGIPQVIKEFKQHQTRPDDVFIVAYPRCGTHWIWEVTSMVANGKAERIAKIKQVAMIEYQQIADWALKTLPSPRILNTHFLPTYFPAGALDENKYIFMIRNPKDVIVSLYQMRISMSERTYEGTLNGFVDLFLEDKMWSGGYFQYINIWWDVYLKNKERFLILAYEDCKKNLPVNVRRIAEFLGREKDMGFYKNVASLCSFERMKADRGRDVFEETFQPDAHGMYRRGMVGNWRICLTPAQSKAVDAKMEREIHDTDLKEMLKRDN